MDVKKQLEAYIRFLVVERSYLCIWRALISPRWNGGATRGCCRGATLIQVRQIFPGSSFGRVLQATVCGCRARN